MEVLVAQSKQGLTQRTPHFAKNALIYIKKSFMDISKIVLFFGISLLIYFSFLFLGFFLKNKNLKAQNLKKEE